jgi:GNAT superfamily N-acetyltransferase
MALLPDIFALLDVSSGRSVQAKIIELTPGLARTHIDSVWWNHLDTTSPAMVPEDREWSWAKLAAKAEETQDFICIGIRLIGPDVICGAMLYQTGARSFFNPSDPANEVMLLATSPSSRGLDPASPGYRGAGSALLLRATAHSYILGLGGRIVLRATSSEAIIQFYRNRGFDSHSTEPGG